MNLLTTILQSITLTITPWGHALLFCGGWYSLQISKSEFNSSNQVTIHFFIRMYGLQIFKSEFNSSPLTCSRKNNKLLFSVGMALAHLPRHHKRQRKPCSPSLFTSPPCWQQGRGSLFLSSLLAAK